MSENGLEDRAIVDANQLELASGSRYDPHARVEVTLTLPKHGSARRNGR